MPEAQPLLNRHEAAAMLRVSVKTLDRLRRERAIEAINIRNRILFRLEAVVAFANQHSTK